MNKSLLLFIIGVVLQVPSFLVSQADNLPWVSALIAPQYFNARKGVERLSQTGILRPGDSGFAHLQIVAMDRLKRDNDPRDLARISVAAFRFGDTTVSPAGQRRNLRLDLSNGQSVDLELTDIEERVALLKSGHFLAYSGLLFMLGLLLECGGFYLERRNAHQG
jgi:hypothetical protein